jgi:uncharacterized membrane protein
VKTPGLKFSAISLLQGGLATVVILIFLAIAFIGLVSAFDTEPDPLMPPYLPELFYGIQVIGPVLFLGMTYYFHKKLQNKSAKSEKDI